MVVELQKLSNVKTIYLEHLKEYPEKACKPEIHDNKYVFRLNLANIYQCMVTKVVDRQAVKDSMILIELNTIRNLPIFHFRGE